MTDRIGRAALAQTIRELEGIDNETRTALLELVNHRKKYGLVWEEHPEEVEERLREQLPVLEEDKALALTDGGKEAPNHVLIEGDNLEALTALTYTHEGKIDVIYIDPPYNTGNKDFVYNDSYVDSEDGYRHSKWLSFMSKRLKIAKRLLSDKGVIFISIDDNEQASLRLLLEEIFKGKSLDRGTLIWENKGSTKGFSKIVKNHEYILAYSKDPNSVISLYNKNFPTNSLIEERLQIKRSPKNPLCQIMFPKGLPIRDVKEITFEEYVGNGTNKIDIISGKMVFREGVLQNDVVLEASFPYRNQTEKFFNALKTGEPVYDTKGQQWLEVYFSKTGVPHYSKQRGYTILSSLLDDIPNSGFSDLQALGLETKFNNPKPVILIYKLLSHFSTDDYTILDFFAGSGTTMHATMQLNKEDGGHRQCILVTNNENNICREVTYERNKRVIQGYTTPKGAEVEGLGQNNLRYYRTKLLPRDTGLAAQRRLMEAATELLCIKHDVYEECTMLGGLRLKPKLCRYFADEGKAGMLIIYRTEAIGRLVEEIKTLPEGGELLVYVFSLSSYAMDADFEEVADRVTLCALPRAIYNAYQKVLPKKGRRQELPPLATSDENTQLTIEEGGEA